MTLGPTVTDTNGRTYVLGAELGVGGQGRVLAAHEVRSKQKYTVKIYDPTAMPRDAETRLGRLVAANLSARSSALCGPISRLLPVHGLGCVQPFADGISLDDLLTKGVSFIDGLGVAIALCRAIAVLEDLGACHGDIAASNVIVQRKGDIFEVFLIDFDNYAAAGIPAPPCRGQDYYGAPELLSGAAPVSVSTDRFALAVLLHELLLLRHPFTVAIQQQVTFDAYVAMLRSATWAEDPAMGGGAPVAGPSARILPRSVWALFRSALQTDPKLRPSAERWANELEAALEGLYECDLCSEIFVNDPTTRECPRCESATPALALEIAGRTIPFDRVSTVVGRDDIGGDPAVSRQHAAFQPRGFLVSVHCLSANGLAVEVGGSWRVLGRGEECLVSVGDRVRLAVGVDGTLQVAKS